MDLLALFVLFKVFFVSFLVSHLVPGSWYHCSESGCEGVSGGVFIMHGTSRSSGTVDGASHPQLRCSNPELLCRTLGRFLHSTLLQFVQLYE